MKRVAFVGCEFWLKRTGSADFFIKLLKENYQVETFSEPKWTMKGNVPVEKVNYHTLKGVAS